uniref:probable G-protein coupled receptor 139 n=1 Tax=Pristiophorus japonicus TaxID=55135 RepID=UPI00398EC53A
MASKPRGAALMEQRHMAPRKEDDCGKNIKAILKEASNLPFVNELLEIVNLLAIPILCRGKCGLSKCVTRYLVAMAAADLMVLFIEVLLYQMNETYGILPFLEYAPLCLVHYALCHVVLDCSVWLTVAFTFDRFVAICCPKLKLKFCTPKISAAVIVTICLLFCLKNIHFYFLYMDSSTSYVRGDLMCWGKLALPMTGAFEEFYWLDRVLNPLLPFCLILLLNALTVRQIIAASRVRRGLRGRSNGENQRDPEMESRRQSIILLFTLSGSFILCWMTTTVVFILSRYLYTDLETAIRLFQAQDVGTVVQLFSCCTNTFIYGVTQTKFREQLKLTVAYPVILLAQLVRSGVMHEEAAAYDIHDAGALNNRCMSWSVTPTSPLHEIVNVARVIENMCKTNGQSSAK